MREIFLSLLASGEAYGYEIRQTLERLFGNLLPPMNAGQIYMTLSRLERDGLVIGSDVEGDSRGKRTYQVTPAGLAVLREWVGAPVQGLQLKDDFFMKFVVAVAARLAEPQELLERQRFEYLRALRALDEQATESLTAELLIEGAILHLKADLEWLDVIERRLPQTGYVS
jgi:DNA-binding PadR family transcriptional regulator